MACIDLFWDQQLTGGGRHHCIFIFIVKCIRCTCALCYHVHIQRVLTLSYALRLSDIPTSRWHHTHIHTYISTSSHTICIYVRMYVIKHPLLPTSYIYNVHIVHSVHAVEMCTNIKYVTSTNV